MKEAVEWRFCKECNQRIFSNEVEGDTIVTISDTVYCIDCAEDILVPIVETCKGCNKEKKHEKFYNEGHSKKTIRGTSYCMDCVEEKALEAFKKDSSTPLFDHDCSHCFFLKSADLEHYGFSDIYICGNEDTVVIRHSSSPSDNRGIAFDHTGEFAEIYKEHRKEEYAFLEEYRALKNK